ncbi:uncharacterized protein [Mytilus edulis]|uniref:uncharacterized protein n=1 Tax=Mytilus edulis TaxID=6550 RepID=UPI0039F0700D
MTVKLCKITSRTLKGRRLMTLVSAVFCVGDILYIIYVEERQKTNTRFDLIITVVKISFKRCLPTYVISFCVGCCLQLLTNAQQRRCPSSAEQIIHLIKCLVAVKKSVTILTHISGKMLITAVP